MPSSCYFLLFFCSGLYFIPSDITEAAKPACASQRLGGIGGHHQPYGYLMDPNNLMPRYLNNPSPVQSKQVSTSGNTDSACLITIEEVPVIEKKTKQDQRRPSTTCDIPVFTKIGSYILSCASPPYRGIIAYSLQCRSPQSPVSPNDGILFQPTEAIPRELRISPTNLDANPVFIAMNDHFSPTAHQIMTDGDTFRISSCNYIFPQYFATDVAMVDTDVSTTLIVFSVFNPNMYAEPHQRYAAAYLSSHANRSDITLCGLVPVEQTYKVTLWMNDGVINAVFVQSVLGTRRNHIRFYEIKLNNKLCKIRSLGQQFGAPPRTSGNSTGSSDPPLKAVKQSYLPIDSVLCGVEDIFILQTEQFTSLVVAISNTAMGDEQFCPLGETRPSGELHSGYRPGICGCANAIRSSFSILYDTSRKQFTLSPYSVQLFTAGPDITTELQAVYLPCCTLIQLCSSTDNCEIYTMRLATDDPQKLELDQISGTTLPTFIRTSAVGQCETNLAIISYNTIEANQESSMFKFSCTPPANQPANQDRSYLLALLNRTGGYVPIREALPRNFVETPSSVFVNVNQPLMTAREADIRQLSTNSKGTVVSVPYRLPPWEMPQQPYAPPPIMQQSFSPNYNPQQYPGYPVSIPQQGSPLMWN